MPARLEFVANRIGNRRLHRQHAIRIIESETVRYSSPILFNDPFDVQAGLHFDFDVEKLPRVLFDRMASLVNAEKRPDIREGDPFSEAILFMWDKKATHGFPEDDMWRLIQGPLTELKRQIEKVKVDYQAFWWDDFLPRVRIFSVSEGRDNLLMWSHYAMSHTGVVLSIRALPEEDNALCVAKPALYRAAPPALFSEGEWIDYALGLRDFDLNALYHDYARVKSDVWSYEKEWRVWYPAEQKGECLHVDHRLRKSELDAVYFGCRVDASAKDTITDLLAANYPETQKFQAYKPVEAYSLQFSPT